MGNPPEFLRLMLGRSLNLSDSDLIFLEGLNYRAKAYFDLARHTGLHLQPFFLALPHQIGATRQNNSIAYKRYLQIREKIETPDKPLDTDESKFICSPIPLLTETLLGHCGDSSKAIAEELLALRHRHRQFRGFLTVYEREWNDASTKDELRQMEQEFDAALQKMVERENELGNRFLYNLWDIVKEPLKILAKSGDKVAEIGHDWYVIGRVKGLHNFWQDLGTSLTAKKARAKFQKLFPNQSNSATWEAAERLANAVNADLKVSSA